MTDQKILEGNKLIAEFLGYKFAGDGAKMNFNITKPGEEHWYYGSWEKPDFNEHIMTEFKYHSSWDWLMPVLKLGKEKIKQADFNTMQEKAANGRLGAALNEAHNINLGNAHYCLVKFIEWYNQQKPS
jgi:hypothetical protein